jgi:hypothetical protein
MFHFLDLIQESFGLTPILDEVGIDHSKEKGGQEARVPYRAPARRVRL